MKISIVSTGVANEASIRAAFGRLGHTALTANDADSIYGAEAVVLPGVGAFGAGMEALQKAELIDSLSERIRANRKTLAVCLGMQLLGTSSEEAPGISGLGVITQSVTAFPDDVVTPQFGWNKVEAQPGTKLLQSGYAYFANSFCYKTPPADWNTATANHGGSFVAAMEKGRVLACQFHPELSGAWGEELLNRWIRLED